MVVDDQWSYSREDEGAKTSMPNDHIQIEVESKDEKCCEKKEEKDEQLEDVDRGRTQPTRKNISRNPVLHSLTKQRNIRHHFIH